MSALKEIICIQCPFACRIQVELDEDHQVSAINNYKCPRGLKYAKQEASNPVRTLTTTVKINSCDEEHPLLPVQTDGPVPKELLMEVMRVLAKIRVEPPIRFNEVILANILGTGVNVKATSEVLK
jgi:CxxC motif-containing protein